MAPAWAGGSAQVAYMADGEQQRVQYEYRGKDVRMGLPSGNEGYLLLKDGVPYSVITEGQTMVLDLRQFLRMMGGMMPAPELPGSDGFVSLRATGRNESVAGVSGQVYLLTYREEGEQRTEEAVLSRDGRAVAFTQAMLSVADILSEAAGQPNASKELTKALDGQGVLRLGQELKVVALDAASPAESRFTLPAAPTQMPSLEGLFGGAGAGGGGAAAAGGGVDFGGLLGGKAARQQERIEGRAEQEVDNATDKAVDRALDKAFQKLFGR